MLECALVMAGVPREDITGRRDLFSFKKGKLFLPGLVQKLKAYQIKGSKRGCFKPYQKVEHLLE